MPIKPITQSITHEQYVHDYADMIVFCLKSELGLLNKNHLILDGTFRWVQCLEGFAQLYNIAIQFDDGQNRVYSYTVVTVMLKSKRKSTYSKMFQRINELYGEDREGSFVPLSIRCDHESSLVSCVTERFPEPSVYENGILQLESGTLLITDLQANLKRSGKNQTLSSNYMHICSEIVNIWFRS